MAFIESYTKLVRDARQNRTPTEWRISEGFDKQRRKVAIAQAIELKRLPAGNDYLALMAPMSPLLTGDAPSTNIPDDVREKLKWLRDSFARGHDTGPSLDAMRKTRTQQLKDAEAAKVAVYMRRQRGAA